MSRSDHPGMCKALFASVFLWLALGAQAGAHDALAEQPNLELLTNGYVTAMARQDNGGLILGGHFTKVNGVARSGLARLKPDGTLDLDWAPIGNGNIDSLAAVGDAVYVGGVFNQVSGVSRSCLAKLSGSGTGAVDMSFNPAPNNDVGAMSPDGTGKLIIGGDFTQVDGHVRNYLAKVDGASGALDTAWTPGVDASVRTIARDGSLIYIAGSFSTVASVTRKYLARISVATGVPDTAWNPAPDDYVSAVGPDGAGNLYIGGFFANVGGQARARLAKLSTSSGLADASWNPSVDDAVRVIVADASSVYLGGDFLQTGGVSRGHIARVSASGAGSVDLAWNPGLDQPPIVMLPNGSGGVVAGGDFAHIAGQRHFGLGNFSSTAQLVGSADLLLPGSVSALGMQSDGSLLIAGDMVFVGDQARNYLLRLLPNGTLDPNWHPIIDGPVGTLAVVGDAVFAGGYFQHAGGLLRNSLVKLSTAGVVDAQWNPAPDSFYVNTLRADGAGSVYVGGAFQHIGGVARPYAAKLSATGVGAVDAAWAPVFSTSVGSLALDGAGSIYATGYFSTVNGVARNKMAKLNAATGALDASWNPTTDGYPGPIVADATRVYLGGSFGKVNGVARVDLAKLSASGSGALDTTWTGAMTNAVFTLQLASDALIVGGEGAVNGNPNTGGVAKLDLATGALVGADLQVNGPVSAVLAAPGSVVHVGGSFSSINYQPRLGYGRLVGDKIFAAGFQ